MKSKYGFYKVANANFKIELADVKKNKKEIIKLIQKAEEEKVSFLNFPELCLTGYTMQDLFLNSSLNDLIIDSIKEIIEIIPQNMFVTVGAPFNYLNNLYDCAFLLTKDKILGIVPKTYLANYNEFYEKRWFSSSLNSSFSKIKILDMEVPFGNNLVFLLGDVHLGIEICEDLWVINPPSNDLSLAGANLILNLSSSPTFIGKNEYRKKLVKFQSAKNYCVYQYVSSGLGESSQDLVFSGSSLIAQEGEMISSKEDSTGLDIAIVDIGKINSDRIKFKSSFEEKPKKEIVYIYYDLNFKINLLPLSYEPYPFLIKDEKERSHRSSEIIDLQAKGLATRLDKSHIDKVVLGLSGGLDSTLALLVCLEAFKILLLDTKNINCLLLPGFATSSQTYKNSLSLIKISGVSFKKINITSLSKMHLKDLNHNLNTFDTTYENTQARIRTLYLMDYANMIGGLVVGTGDLSELALGFSTYNGDHMAMYNVNSSVPKTLVKYIIKDYINDHPQFKKVLNSILDTPISPELIPSKDGEITQKTEDIIGKYDLHDFFLYNFLRNNFSKEKILQLAYIAFNKLSKEYIKKTLDLFFKRFFMNQFKRSCLPDGPKVGSVCLSPRGDFRMASDIDPNNSFNK